MKPEDRHHSFFPFFWTICLKKFRTMTFRICCHQIIFLFLFLIGFPYKFRMSQVSKPVYIYDNHIFYQMMTSQVTIRLGASINPVDSCGGYPNSTHFTKVCFFKNVLGNIVWPKNSQKLPVEFIDFNDAVCVNFWVKQFSQVRS